VPWEPTLFLGHPLLFSFYVSVGTITLLSADRHSLSLSVCVCAEKETDRSPINRTQTQNKRAQPCCTGPQTKAQYRRQSTDSTITGPSMVLLPPLSLAFIFGILLRLPGTTCYLCSCSHAQPNKLFLKSCPGPTVKLVRLCSCSPVIAVWHSQLT
jgi:hypothetical protein